jgi:exosortase
MKEIVSRGILFGAYCLCVAAAYSGVLRSMFAYARANETASHIVLVPLVTLVLLFWNRRSIESSTRSTQTNVVGAVVAVLGFLWGRGLSWPGSPEPSLTIAVSGLVVSWIGGFLFFYGREAVKTAWFALLFLCFMIPAPAAVIDTATAVLKTGSTETVAALFRLTGTPFFREGFVFALPDFVIEVANECSGIRSSIALLLTGSLAAYMFLDNPWGRTVLMAAIVPIAILKNGIRIASLSWLAMHVDPGFLTGQLHHEGGVVFFLLALAMLMPIMVGLRRLETRVPGAISRPAGGGPGEKA